MEGEHEKDSIINAAEPDPVEIVGVGDPEAALRSLGEKEDETAST